MTWGRGENPRSFTSVCEGRKEGRKRVDFSYPFVFIYLLFDPSLCCGIIKGSGVPRNGGWAIRGFCHVMSRGVLFVAPLRQFMIIILCF